MDVTDSALEYFMSAAYDSSADPEPFWERVSEALRQRADRWMYRGVRLHERDDIVVAAFLTVWKRRREGQFSTIDSVARLHGLLLRIVDNKARNVLRVELSHKRGAGCVRREDSAVFGGQLASLNDVRDGEPTPEEALVAADTLRHLLEGIDLETQAIVFMRLQGHGFESIAAHIGCAVSTVSRKLRRIEAQWRRELGDE